MLACLVYIFVVMYGRKQKRAKRYPAKLSGINTNRVYFLAY